MKSTKKKATKKRKNREHKRILKANKKLHKKLLLVFEPKSEKDIFEDYCKHYGLTYPVSSVEDFKANIIIRLREIREEKMRWVKGDTMDFEKAAFCRDKERTLDKHLTCFELGSFMESETPTLQEWMKYVTLEF